MGTVFTRTSPDGKEQTREAHTPADAVRLRFDGWVEKPHPAARSNKTEDGAAKPASK